MNAYEEAMKRLELEDMMASALCTMWELAEEGEFHGALTWQFEYLMARDEYLSAPRVAGANDLYWRLKVIATFGSDTHEF